MATITPRALRRGDTVAFISPSNRFTRVFPARIARGRAALEKCGFNVILVESEGLSDNHLEAVRQRCDELHRAFADPSVTAIFCVTGGLSANELLPHLDYDLIRKNPKIFCGYSDITILHHAFFTQAGLRTFYGPAVVTQLGEYPEPLAFTFDHLKKVLMTAVEPVGQLPRSEEWTDEFLDWFVRADEARPRRMQPSNGWRWLRSGKAEATLFGGCLPTVTQLAATKFLPDYTGKILLLEVPEGHGPDLPTPVEQARASLADLRNQGVLQQVAGLVFGRTFRYTETMDTKLMQIIVDQCYGTDFPILANVNVGHSDPILTIPLGALARLDSEADRFEILEPAVMLP